MEDNKIVNNSQLNKQQDEVMENQNKELVLEKEEPLTENVNNQQPEVLNYKRVDVDGKTISNSEDIEYFKTIQATDIVDNCMLGDFDDNGNYVVQKHIVDAIVKMKKIYISAFEKSIYCESVKQFDNYGKINLRLRIVPNTPTEGYTTAVLELLETVNKVNGYFINTNHVTLLGAQFKGEENIEKIFKFFNIVDITDGVDDGALTENNQDVLDIINRINYLQMVKEGQKKFMSKYQKDLYNKKIQLLSKSKTGAPLLEDFNKEYFYVLSKFTSKENPDFYKHLNQLLDAIIERNIDFIKEDKNLMKDLRSLQSAQAKLFNVVNNQLKSELESKNVVKQNANAEKELKEAKAEVKKEDLKSNKKSETKVAEKEQKVEKEDSFAKEKSKETSAFSTFETESNDALKDLNQFSKEHKVEDKNKLKHTIEAEAEEEAIR